MSSSICTPLLSLHTTLLSTPLYYLFTPHSITKFSHPTLSTPPRLCSPKPILLISYPKQNPQIRRTDHPPHPNPENPRSSAPKPRQPPKSANRPSSAPKPREPTILRTETQTTSQIRRTSKFALITHHFSWFFWFFVSGIFVPGFGNMNLSLRISLNPVVS